MSSRNAIAYQATDLARSHREVLDAARKGSALIRDKDGMTLELAPVELREHAQEVADLAVGLWHAEIAMRDPASEISAYGNLAWLSVLPTDAQRTFIAEATDAMFLAHSGLDTESARRLLSDWRATAEAWSDPDTRQRLLADEDEPLHDREL